MTADSTAAAKKATSQDNHPWMLAVLLLGLFMALLDTYIVNVAMPSIGTDLHASGAALQLIVGGYTIAYAMMLITGARLGDLYGRRRMYSAGALGFTVASLICGLAPDSAVLIIFRFVQGGSAAVMIPQIMSVIQMRFSGAARAKALSIYAVVLSVGAVFGLVLGGLIVNANLFGTHWRPAFLVNVPFGIVLLALVPRTVPADTAAGTRRLDPLGLVTAVAAVFLVVLPLVLGHQIGWPAWTFASMAVGAVIGVVFVLVEKRVSAGGGDPLLDLAVLRSPGLPSGLATMLAVSAPYGGLLFVFTLHLQSGLGDSAMHAGVTFIPMAVASAVVGFYWRKFPARMHFFVPVIGSVVLALGCLAITATMHDGSADNALTWVDLAITGAGIGMAISPVLAVSLVGVPMKRAADASGLATTAMQLGQVVGIAAFGTVYLSLADFSGRSGRVSASSGHALGVTASSAAAVAIFGAVCAALLARAARRAAARAAGGYSQGRRS